VFIAFSGEEKGLLGSAHYLKNPLFPLSETVAMFNYDMIGRLRNGELTINGVRSAVEFPQLVDRANGDETLKLKKVDRVVRSGDHFGFYQNGVPSFHFFTGLTDEYHTPDDDFETLNMSGVLQTVDYTERLLDQVLALPQRPEFIKPTSQGPAKGGMAYLGVTPDYSAEARGLRISEIAENSPAAKAGLKAGDVIVQFHESKVSDVPSLIGGLRKHKPGDMVKVVVRRGEEDVSCDVTLGRP
jgi:Zn-dependent M28 family amino/carboxypeptidase